MTLGPLAHELIKRFQQEMPLESRPFAAMGREVGASEEEVIQALEELRDEGTLSRIGAVIPPGVLGASTLAAMEVPPDRLVDVAGIVGSYVEVNHNYERGHALNLWFVVTAPDRHRVDAVLAEIEQRTGLDVLDLPLERSYRIDLGFAIP